MPTPWPQPWPVTIRAVPARAKAAPAAATAETSTTAIPSLTRKSPGRVEPNPPTCPDLSAGRSLDSGPMRRLLVANRGEIALRIFRACRAQRVETGAVATPEDRGALHASSADAVVEISSYLGSAEHLRAAREAAADAVHPGYGFLSESARLAEAGLQAGRDLG